MDSNQRTPKGSDLQSDVIAAIRLAQMYVPILICTKMGNFFSSGTIRRFDANGLWPRRRTVLSRAYFLGREMEAIAHNVNVYYKPTFRLGGYKRTRTYDHSDISRKLYQLSYVSKNYAFLISPKSVELSPSIRRYRRA